MRLFVSLLRFRFIFILFFVFLFFARMLCEMYSSRDIWASWCNNIKETIEHHAVLLFPFYASTSLTLII